ncbi:MAG TPA: 30S ribosomal protein S16 [Pseudonocardiaceae bacterium]|nr:30S ribosomal protein S16 [Pseudonocardiaceae bacterium]
MAVKIKLMRLGKIRQPYYRIVVADARTRRDGKAIEAIGKYHPKEDPSLIEVDSERVQYWLGVGAKPTEPVQHLLEVTGDWQKFTGQPGAEGTLRRAEPKPDKAELFAKALADAGEAPSTQATTPKKKSSKKTEGAAQGASATSSTATGPTEGDSAKAADAASAAAPLSDEQV